MKLNISKLNKIDVKTLKINIKLIVENLFIINLTKIKPMTNTLNNNYYLLLQKDKIKKNKKITNYILSAHKKNNYFIIIPNIL